MIWHIDYGADGYGPSFRHTMKNEGHPGQADWPARHYGVALQQPDGLYEIERGVSRGDRDDVFHASGANELIPCLNPSACQYPNTDSYRDGIVRRGNVFITDISNSGDVMSFRYDYANGNEGGKIAFPSAMPSFSPSFAPSNAPTTNPTPEPTLELPANQCFPGDTAFKLKLLTDYWAVDTSWTLKDDDSGEVMAASDSSLESNREYLVFKCLPQGKEFTFTLYDSWGDSICCEYGPGHFSVSLNGKEEFEGGKDFGHQTSYSFSTAVSTEEPGSSPTGEPSTSPTFFPSPTPTDAPSDGPTHCVCF